MSSTLRLFYSPDPEPRPLRQTSIIQNDIKSVEEQKRLPLKRSLSSTSDDRVDGKRAKIEPTREILVAVDLYVGSIRHVNFADIFSGTTYSGAAWAQTREVYCNLNSLVP